MMYISYLLSFEVYTMYMSFISLFIRLSSVLYKDLEGNGWIEIMEHVVMFPYQKKILRDTRLESTFFHTYKTTPDGNKRFIWLLSIFKVIAKWQWYIFSFKRRIDPGTMEKVSYSENILLHVYMKIERFAHMYLIYSKSPIAILFLSLSIT